MAPRKPSMAVKLQLPQRSATKESSTASSSTNPGPAQPSVLPPATNILTQITNSHMVLALTLQKSKPKDLSIKEYCEQLQAHIKDVPRVIPEQQQFIDTAGFWKEQCGKIHQEKKALEDKVRCAEESNRLLRQALQERDSTPGSDESIDLDGPSSHNPGPSRSRKRPSPTLEEDFEEILPTLTLPPADDDLLRLSEYVLQLKRQRSKLEEACKDFSTVDQIDTLTKQTIRMLALLGTPFFECCLPFLSLKMTTSRKHIINMIERVIKHVGVSFMACFTAFNELCRTISGRAKKAELVFHLVMFFSKSLELLKTFSDLQAEEASLHHRGRNHKRVRVEQEEFAINNYLSNMLTSVSYGLEWKVQQPGHSELLEGILFSVIENAGRLLSESVFEEHVADSNNPGNISKGHSRKFSDASRIEARYIVQILHATLGGEDKKDLVAQILLHGRTPAGQPRHTSTNVMLSGDVLLKAKNLLQSTLMKTSVGGEELETLRLPTPPLETTEVAVSKKYARERYGADWLVETMWALIGWDLMN